MQTYRVFNERAVMVTVTDQDLTSAALEAGPLPTHLANAAAIARRHDLAERLRATLSASQRPARLAAAKALLALGDTAARSALEQQAQQVTDAVSADMFRVIALRLDGVSELRAAFEHGKDAALCSMIPSMYNSQLELTVDDHELISILIAAYVAKKPDWIARLGKDEWRNALYVLVTRLDSERARELRQQLDANGLQRLRSALAPLATSTADAETKKAAKRLSQELAEGR